HKRLNLRFLVVLLGAMAALGGAAHLLHAYQVRRNAHAFLDLAASAEREGRLADATNYLGRYVGLQPNDADSLTKLGQLLTDERMAKSNQAKQRALLVLNKVLYLDPERLTVRRMAAKLAMDLGRYADARDDLAILIAAFPNDGELEMMLARCYEKTLEYRK